MVTPHKHIISRVNPLDISWKLDYRKRPSKFQPYQWPFIRDLHSSTCVMIAGAGSGKTLCAIAKHVMLAIINGSHKEGQTTRSAYILPVYRMIRNIALDIFQGIFDHIKETTGHPILDETYGTGGYHKEEAVFKLRNGHKILMLTSENPNRIQGPDLTHVTLDEIGRWIKEESFDHAIMRGRDPAGTINQINVVTSPESGHWSHYRLHEDFKKKDITIYDKISLLQNAAIAPEVKNRALKNLSEKQKAQLIDGLYVSPKGLVFKTFAEAQHVIRCSYKKSEPVWIGYDFGKATASAVFLTRHPSKPGAYVIIDEIHFREIWFRDTVHILRDYIADKDYYVEELFADPNDQRRQTLKHIRYMRDIFEFPVSNQAGYYERDKDTGLDVVQTALRRWDDRAGDSIRLYLSDDLVSGLERRRERDQVEAYEDSRKRNIIDMFRQFKYREHRSGEVYQGVLDDYSILKHGYDALKYACVPLFQDIFEVLVEREEQRRDGYTRQRRGRYKN